MKIFLSALCALFVCSNTFAFSIRHDGEFWIGQGYMSETFSLDGQGGGEFNDLEGLIITIGFFGKNGKIIEQVDSEPTDLSMTGATRYSGTFVEVSADVVSDAKCMRIMKATYINQKGNRVPYPLENINVIEFKPEITLQR